MRARMCIVAAAALIALALLWYHVPFRFLEHCLRRGYVVEVYLPRSVIGSDPADDLIWACGPEQ
jgi:hypothetical protein